MTKYEKFEMLDRYEISEALERAKIDPENCFSKTCLVEAGKLLNADKILSGSIDIG